jgi:hypothetical protein
MLVMGGRTDSNGQKYLNDMIALFINEQGTIVPYNIFYLTF